MDLENIYITSIERIPLLFLSKKKYFKKELKGNMALRT